MPPRRPPLWVQALGHERGAVLWLPGLLFAAWVVLFAIRLAPGGTSLFTRTTGFRVVVGGWHCHGDCGNGADRVRRALEAGLRAHGDVTLVDPARVAQRLRAAGVLGTEDPVQFFHAVRPLNAHLGVSGSVRRTATGYEADLRANDARSGGLVFERLIQGQDPETLGAALADSIRLLAFAPAVPPGPAPGPR